MHFFFCFEHAEQKKDVLAKDEYTCEQEIYALESEQRMKESRLENINAKINMYTRKVKTLNKRKKEYEV